MIKVTNLQKSYKDFQAVKGISFEVNEGEIFGFLGPNGAGKSTTINMLCTMLKPSGGNIFINGYDVQKEKDDVRKSVGIIFQENTLDEKLTAKENLMLHCKFYRVPRKEREKRIQEVLEIVDLVEKKEGLVESFSGGMKRRLEIARGLLHYPKVLFLDEPTVGLDPQTRSHIWEYILKLKEKEGITMFLTTHYLDEAEISDRIAIMDHGKIIAIDTPNKLKQQVGGDIIEISTKDNVAALKEIEEKIESLEVTVKEDIIRLKVTNSDAFISDFIKNMETPITSLNIRKPTLNDVFLTFTGRDIREEEASKSDQFKQNMKKMMK
ncbi:ATP-binding cassette domain-containing protein [Evansella sp. AB-P1]|uniref:ATP-binding cassette domain-containing protein n=1 Tax=Evansella sp. AB-P1 TaxID=3037653 RepID=UPI00241CA451|nr:ATP-binding cassette domain-containing protein [Evansella sp. AB-P1]MDG5788368.1 ATP-binding cassette domain-containing protein [Evansella sp. AB-P1]